MGYHPTRAHLKRGAGIAHGEARSAGRDHGCLGTGSALLVNGRRIRAFRRDVPQGAWLGAKESMQSYYVAAGAQNMRCTASVM